MLIALASLLAAACRRGVPAPDRGVRLVSLSPSTTEAVFAIGAGERLVGRSRHCDYPPEALRLPSVGGYADPSVEAILALSPTLVVGARGPAGPALEQTLNAHGIATYFPETESLAQIEEMIGNLGSRLGNVPGAERVIAEIRAQRRAVEDAVKDKPRVRAVMVFDTSPVFVAGPGSFADELIRISGGDNAITRGGAYPSIGIEHLLALDPDVLLDGASLDGASNEGAPLLPSKLATLRDAPGWSALRAMQQGRVRPLRTDVTLRPGPRIGEGLVLVARALHGDALAIAGATALRPGSLGSASTLAAPKGP